MPKRKLFAPSPFLVTNSESVTQTNPPQSDQLSNIIEFPENATDYTSFNLAPWLGHGVDEIITAMREQIYRFLGGLDGAVEPSTTATNCRLGFPKFLSFLIAVAATRRESLKADDINAELISGFICHLHTYNISEASQRNYYGSVKAILYPMGMRNVFKLIIEGDHATFPTNPFPHADASVKGEVILSKVELRLFTRALKKAIEPLWQDDTPITHELLSYALVATALYTGANTTPLIEMETDCLKDHPKKGCSFLILKKRRSHTSRKATLRSASQEGPMLELAPTVRLNIEKLIRRVIKLTDPIRAQAPSHLRNRVWVYLDNSGKKKQITNCLQNRNLSCALHKLVKQHKLTDIDGNPLRINVSRLRKTFSNHIYEYTNGDALVTARALGNSTPVAQHSYLRATEESKRNWRFMGELLVSELLENTIGATYKPTPSGHCSSQIPEYKDAPEGAGATCFAFTNCIRCRHYAVTSDDLYKLFSFYFRVLDERNRMEKKQWKKQYSHIPRIIDHYIVSEGIRRRIFTQFSVDAAKSAARLTPHPFWAVDVIPSLEIFT